MVQIQHNTHNAPDVLGNEVNTGIIVSYTITVPAPDCIFFTSAVEALSARDRRTPEPWALLSEREREKTWPEPKIRAKRS